MHLSCIYYACYLNDNLLNMSNKPNEVTFLPNEVTFKVTVSEAEMDNQMKYFEHYLILDTNMLYELTREVPPELKKKYDLK